MSHSRALWGRVFLAIWDSGAVSMVDALQIPKAVSDAYTSVGKPLIYVAVFSPRIPPPQDDVRKVMADNMDAMLEHCEAMHLVFEGTGFGHTMQRMAMASILLIAGKRKKVHIAHSLKDAISQSPEIGGEIAVAVKKALQSGFLPPSKERVA
jgi:hypothetical protein